MGPLKTTFPNDEALINFWKNLKIGYNWFEKSRKPPKISVNRQGVYQFSDSALE